jgi:hypothetical protein
VVVHNLAAAAEFLAEGINVVLVAEVTGEQLDLPADGPGRLAVLVGSPGDPHVRRVAEAMAAELFGRGSAAPGPRPAT